MAKIRKVEVQNFRCISQLEWCPRPGINCLIGPGDSGKSSLLDAIDFCLGARRNLQFSDADFHRMDVSKPIQIDVTLGELDDGLKNIDNYGLFVRGFDTKTGKIDEEPDKDLETVLTVRLTVASDLDAMWSLVSERGKAQGQLRNLQWSDRVRIAPSRIGIMADYHLSWRRGSVLNRISEERADTSAALAKAARDARAAFGNEAEEQLGETLDIVANTAKDLGILVGDNLKAQLDAHSVSFTGGTISLHDENGIPLRGLGIGSTRLLIAGLQRKAAAEAQVILVDELEYGLEPHRVIRLLGSLGAKDTPAPLQVFMTTHSPVAVRELSGEQLMVLRATDQKHSVTCVSASNDVQGTVRRYPEAFLAKSVLVCEGASEVGLVRGLDQYFVNAGKTSVWACGGALVDASGGHPDKILERGRSFIKLGYRCAVLMDDDVAPTVARETAFRRAGGTVFTWQPGRSLEDEIFLTLSVKAISRLLDFAVEIKGEQTVDGHIRTASNNTKDLADINYSHLMGDDDNDNRGILAKACSFKGNEWFKSVSTMEEVACRFIGPDLGTAGKPFRTKVKAIFAWLRHA